MAEEIASFYLMILVAIADHELHEEEATKIKEITNKYKVEFDLYAAAEEIKREFKNEFNKACDYYISIIQNTEIQKDTIEFIKEIAYADKKLHDKEIGILERCRKKWNID